MTVCKVWKILSIHPLSWWCAYVCIFMQKKNTYSPKKLIQRNIDRDFSRNAPQILGTYFLLYLTIHILVFILSISTSFHTLTSDITRHDCGCGWGIVDLFGVPERPQLSGTDMLVILNNIIYTAVCLTFSSYLRVCLSVWWWGMQVPHAELTKKV